jgi:hypothetical protein
MGRSPEITLAIIGSRVGGGASSSSTFGDAVGIFRSTKNRRTLTRSFGSMVSPMGCPFGSVFRAPEVGSTNGTTPVRAT